MFHKVKTVKPLPGYLLAVSFENDEQKQYDVKPLFDKWDAFKALALVKNLFEQVQVDVGGYGVSWNDDIDLSCDELYNNGCKIGELNVQRVITEALKNQFDSTFHMAKVLVQICPEEIWASSYNDVPFWQQVFHYVYE
ncbi:MAG: DUF2442 domain-containing protein [Clostridiales bacterium]|jgi:hypothetical protein|nr:DUF2442 domain-containing protein [Clostridiales bacterium]